MSEEGRKKVTEREKERQSVSKEREGKRLGRGRMRREKWKRGPT